MNAKFGWAIDADSDKIVIGAMGDPNNDSGYLYNSGAAYVYDANDLSAAPTKLTAPDYGAGDRFGESVGIYADKIVVGSHFDDDNGSDSGSVYVYDANDLSAQPTKLTAFDGAADDSFGNAVAVG
jgi:hypothetical protein